MGKKKKLFSTLDSHDEKNPSYSEDDFKRDVDERFETIKDKLDRSVENVHKDTFETKPSSTYLIKKLKLQKGIHLNSKWKGHTPKGKKFKCFAIILKKYKRIFEEGAENFWYFELHYEDKIEGIICLKNELNSILSKLDYDNKLFREQTEIGKEIIAPDEIEEDFIYDWRDHTKIYEKNVVTDVEMNNLFNTNPKLIFSILGYSILSSAIDEMDIEEHKILIPNIIYDEFSSDFVKKLINSCYLRTNENEKLNLPYIDVNKKTSLADEKMDWRPLILSYKVSDKNDNTLLITFLENYYKYLALNRLVEFPYKGIPIVLSGSQISDDFFTIDATNLNTNAAEQIYKTLNKLFRNLFYEKDIFTSRKYEKLCEKFNWEKILSDDLFIDLEISEDELTPEICTKLALYYSLSMAIKASFKKRKRKRKNYLPRIFDVLFDSSVTDYEDLKKIICNEELEEPEKKTLLNKDNFVTVINKLNEMLANNEIKKFDSVEERKKLETDDNKANKYKNICFTTNVGKSSFLFIGEMFYNEIISYLNIINYSYEDFTSNAKEYNLSDYNSEKNKKRVTIGNDSPYFLALITKDNQIPLPK